MWKEKLHILECFVCKSNKRIKDHTQSEKAVELHFLNFIVFKQRALSSLSSWLLFAKRQYNMKSNTIVCHQRDVPVMFCFVSFKWTDLPTESIHRTLAEIH